MYDGAGTFRGFSKITRDLTDRKKSEENARLLAEEAAARRVAEENARLLYGQRERLHVTLESIGDAVSGARQSQHLQAIADRGQGIAQFVSQGGEKLSLALLHDAVPTWVELTQLPITSLHF